MKKILTKDDEKNRYLKIREMVKTYPNDMELGGKVRELFWEINLHIRSLNEGSQPVVEQEKNIEQLQMSRDHLCS